MLFKETVESTTLDLIRGLQSDPILKGFVLVGGTALSLMIGHRKSIDIDLFTSDQFDSISMLEHLEKKYNFSVQYSNHNTIKGIISGVFVDLKTHSYPYVDQPVYIEDMILASKQDIAAMKLNAVTGNGTRAKDFIDICFLLKEYSLRDLVSFYSRKYSERNTFHVVKSLTWFDEMDENTWPVLVREPFLTPENLRNALKRASKEMLDNPV